MPQVSLNDVAQTLARSVDPKGTDKLFKDDPTPYVQGDREAPQDGRAKFIEDENRLVKEAKPADHEKFVDKEALLTSLNFCNLY